MLLLIPLALVLTQQRTPLPVPAQDNPRLAEIEKTGNDLIKEGKYAELMKGAPAQRAEILKMIEADQLGTATDFIRASKLYDDPTGWYEVRRSEHEYALMALALGSKDAPTNLRRTWDFLMASLGQHPRFGFMKSSPQFPLPERLLSIYPPAALRRIFDEPEAAIADAKDAAESAEIKKLRDDDQAIRSGPIDVKKLHEEAANDAARRRKVVELLEKGVPKTGADFDALGLVMQHGDNFDDFRLACELATASVILGHKDPWLIPATYDRMLLSVGQRQRFGTQFSENGLRPLDPVGINDRIRLQFRLPKLADLKAREQEILKRSFGGLPLQP
ncbi:MAG: hypothetical protein ACAH95_12080 [Fimbriimonas sp.]